MGQVARMFDGLRNLVSGIGGGSDKAMGATFELRIPGRPEIDACYRGTWLGRKIHDIPALDMTREWRGWQADDDQIESIEQAEKQLQIRIRVRRALVMSKLYGGAALIMGLPGNASQPAPEKIGKGQLKYVHMVHRYQLSLAEQNRDLADPMFGRPQLFRLTHGVEGDGIGVDIHPSRIVPFVGSPLPDGAMGTGGEDWFWGDPVLASVFQALAAHDTGVAAISALLNEAKVDVVHVPGFMDNLTSTEYERTLMERFTLAAMLKSITNTLVLDGGDGTENSGERWETRQIKWEGLPEVQRMLFQLVSGAADIPATRLIGQSPTGMNATGEGDTRNYYDMLASLQNSDLTPTMAQLDEYLIQHATGGRDPSIFYNWNPLWQLSPGEKSERDKRVAETANVYASMGAIPDDALAVAIQNRLIEDGVFPGLEAALEEAEKEARMAAAEEMDPAANPEMVEGEMPDPANQNEPGEGPTGRRPAVGQGRGSAVTAMSGNSRRRAANDRARRYVRDQRGLSTHSTELLLSDKFNPNQPRHEQGNREGGRWRSTTGGSVVFEIAPDPDDKEALERWNALSDDERARITEVMADEFAPQITERMGVEAEMFDAVGGFKGQINPSRILVVNDRAFEVAGALGQLFDQQAMVVYGVGKGYETNNMISIDVGDATPAQLRGVQKQLGEFAEDGWTYRDGRVEILNFSEQGNVEYATAIDQRLGGRYRVGHGVVTSAYVERDSYVSPRNDREGTTWGQVASEVRQSFASRLNEEIEGKGKAKADQVGDRYNPNQPRHAAGSEQGGEWASAGGAGAGTEAGTIPLTDETKAKMAADNKGKSIDQLRLEAGTNQVALAALGTEIQGALGVEFQQPPPGKEIKSAERILEKLGEGYDGPHQLRDISRATFIVPTGEKADLVVGALSARGTVYDRGWARDKAGYSAQFLYLQHPNGGVSEIQMVPSGIQTVKSGQGHKLYEVMRTSTDSTVVRAAARKSRTIYNRVLHKSFYARVGIRVGRGQ